MFSDWLLGKSLGALVMITTRVMRCNPSLPTTHVVTLVEASLQADCSVLAAEAGLGRDIPTLICTVV